MTTTTKPNASSGVMGETMDRLIWAAWRAFWVGLGASVVIIGQSLLAPAPSAQPSAAEIAPPPAVQHAPAVDAPRISAVKVRTRTAS